MNTGKLPTPTPVTGGGGAIVPELDKVGRPVGNGADCTPELNSIPMLGKIGGVTNDPMLLGLPILFKDGRPKREVETVLEPVVLVAGGADSVLLIADVN
jgi:hypothetical protein